MATVGIKRLSHQLTVPLLLLLLLLTLMMMMMMMIGC